MPGMLNTVSVITTPPISRATPMPITVMIGTPAFFSACFISIVRAETPAGVQLVHSTEGRVAPEVLLGQGRAVEDLIDARHTHHDAEEDHDHDAFDSVAVDLQVADRQRLLAALAALTQRHEIYRVKGFVALPGAAMRLLVQGVGQRFDSHFDRPWGAAEARATRLVLIGDHLDAAALQAELQAQLDAVAA